MQNKDSQKQYLYTHTHTTHISFNICEMCNIYRSFSWFFIKRHSFVANKVKTFSNQPKTDKEQKERQKQCSLLSISSFIMCYIVSTIQQKWKEIDDLFNDLSYHADRNLWLFIIYPKKWKRETQKKNHRKLRLLHVTHRCMYHRVGVPVCVCVWAPFSVSDFSAILFVFFAMPGGKKIITKHKHLVAVVVDNSNCRMYCYFFFNFLPFLLFFQKNVFFRFSSYPSFVVVLLFVGYSFVLIECCPVDNGTNW